MSEEPLFDPSLKKRKKKQVAFSEDPLGADADPTTPAPATIDNVATNGDAVDMGPKTVHEQMAQERAGEGEDAAKAEDDEFKAMFGDMKKKKKKKDLPVDLVRVLVVEAVSQRLISAICVTSIHRPACYVCTRGRLTSRISLGSLASLAARAA